MSVEQLISEIESIGAGASIRDIANKKSKLIAAVNLGIISDSEIRDEVNKCGKVLDILDGSMQCKFIDYSGGTGGREWKHYVNPRSKEAAQFEKIVNEMYREDGSFQLLIMKKPLGIKAVAQYKGGTLQGLFLFFSNRMGEAVDRKGVHIKGVPEYIDDRSSNVIRVYGTLTVDLSDVVRHRYGKEKDLATFMVEQLQEDGLGALRFVAEYVEGKQTDLSDRLEWASDSGFNVADYCIVDTDIYEYDDYIGEKSVNMFDYSNENEVLDSILVMINSAEKTKLALMSLDEHFNENVVAIRCVDNSDKELLEAKINGIELKVKDGVCNIVMSINRVTTKSGFDIDEVNISVDDVYLLEGKEYITLEVVGNNIRVLKEA